MESYRIYKSLPLDDFMDDVQFVTAKCGLLLTPVAQEINYRRKLDPQTEDYWKQRFMDKARKVIEKEKANLNCDLRVMEMSGFGFWMFLPIRREAYSMPEEKLQELFAHYIDCKRKNQAHPSCSQDSLWAAGECSEAEIWLKLFGVDTSYERTQPMIDGKIPVKVFD